MLSQLPLEPPGIWRHWQVGFKSILSEGFTIEGTAGMQPIPYPLLYLSAWWQPSARLEQCPGTRLVQNQGGLLQSKQPGPASVLSLIIGGGFILKLTLPQRIYML